MCIQSLSIKPSINSIRKIMSVLSHSQLSLSPPLNQLTMAVLALQLNLPDLNRPIMSLLSNFKSALLFAVLTSREENTMGPYHQRLIVHMWCAYM